MAYSPYYALWKNFPDTTTPVNAAALNNIEAGISAASDPDNFLQKGATTGQALVWNGTKWAPGSVTTSMVTALPGSPTDGQEIVLVDSLTAPTYQWHLKYVSAKASNKWIAVGGAPAVATVGTAESTNSTSWTDLTTAGPSITVPVAGSYHITMGVVITPSADYQTIGWAAKLGSAATSDNDGFFEPASNMGASDYPRQMTLGPRTLAASDVVKMQYRVGGSYTPTYKRRQLIIHPLQLGG